MSSARTIADRSPARARARAGGGEHDPTHRQPGASTAPARLDDATIPTHVPRRRRPSPDRSLGGTGSASRPRRRPSASGGPPVGIPRRPRGPVARASGRTLPASAPAPGTPVRGTGAVRSTGHRPAQTERPHGHDGDGEGQDGRMFRRTVDQVPGNAIRPTPARTAICPAPPRSRASSRAADRAGAARSGSSRRRPRLLDGSPVRRARPGRPPRRARVGARSTGPLDRPTPAGSRQDPCRGLLVQPGRRLVQDQEAAARSKARATATRSSPRPRAPGRHRRSRCQVRAAGPRRTPRRRPPGPPPARLLGRLRFRHRDVVSSASPEHRRMLRHPATCRRHATGRAPEVPLADRHRTRVGRAQPEEATPRCSCRRRSPRQRDDLSPSDLEVEPSRTVVPRSACRTRTPSSRTDAQFGGGPRRPEPSRSGSPR